MDDPTTDRASGKSGDLPTPKITSTPRERILAGVLVLVYLGGWALAGYADALHIEYRWPARAFWVVFAAWFAVMLVLPIVVVMLFFGRPENPAWLRGRFSLRALLIITTCIAVVLGAIVGAVEFFNSTP